MNNIYIHIKVFRTVLHVKFFRTLFSNYQDSNLSVCRVVENVPSLSFTITRFLSPVILFLYSNKVHRILKFKQKTLGL